MGIFSPSKGGAKRMIEFVETIDRTNSIIDLLNRNDIVKARELLIQWNKESEDKLNEFYKEFEKNKGNIQVSRTSETYK